MKRLIYFVFFILLLIGGVIAALPFILSADIIREQVTAAVKTQTGRDLIIEGNASLSVLPNIALKVGKASLSNTAEMGGGTFARMEEFRLGLELMPLLSGKMRVSGLSLTNPTILLKRFKSGAANWELEKNQSSQPVKNNQQSASLPLNDLSFGDITIVNGTISFVDEQKGTQTKFEEINVTLNLPNLESMLEANGSVMWNKSVIKGNFALKSPNTVLAGDSSQFSIDVQSEQVKTKFVGQMVIAKDGISAEGNLNISTPSLRKLAAWTGSPLPQGSGLQGFSVVSRLQATPALITLNEAVVVLDGMKSEGNLVVKLVGKRPDLQATLAVDAIDLNVYTADSGTSAQPAKSKKTSKSNSAKKSSRSDQPAIKASAAAKWDTTPINFSALGAIDADLRLSTGSITYQTIKIGKSALTVSIKDRLLTANLSELRLYKGSSKGQVIVDARKKTPTMSIETNISNVQALQFLQDINGFDWIEGLANITLDVTTAGRSQNQLAQALKGKAGFSFANGAIRGINIAKMVRNVKNLNLSGWSRSKAEKTDFSKLGATFTLNKGQATTTDLSMISPFIRLTGKGTVNLPAKALDFRLQPKLVGSTEGQGGAVDLTGLDIPVTVKGPWSNPSIRPDLKGLLKDPQNIKKTVKEIGKALKKTKPKDLLKNLLGGSDQQSSGNDTLNASGLLKNLLKSN
jgi:AsmA protein